VGFSLAQCPYCRKGIGPEPRARPSLATEMCCGTEADSYLRLIDSCITQFKAQGPVTRVKKKKKKKVKDLGCRV